MGQPSGLGEVFCARGFMSGCYLAQSIETRHLPIPHSPRISHGSHPSLYGVAAGFASQLSTMTVDYISIPRSEQPLWGKVGTPINQAVIKDWMISRNAQ